MFWLCSLPGHLYQGYSCLCFKQSGTKPFVRVVTKPSWIRGSWCGLQSILPIVRLFSWRCQWFAWWISWSACFLCASPSSTFLIGYFEFSLVYFMRRGFLCFLFSPRCISFGLHWVVSLLCLCLSDLFLFCVLGLVWQVFWLLQRLLCRGLATLSEDGCSGRMIILFPFY